MSRNTTPILTPPRTSFLTMSQPDPEDRASHHVPCNTFPDHITTDGKGVWKDPNDGPPADPAAELVKVAKEIRAWQQGRRWTDMAMLSEFTGLGSDKTYKKLWSGNTTELDIARQYRNYRAVADEIELIEEAEAAEPVYDDIGHVPAILNSLGRFIVQRGLRRFFLIEGPSGSGKTTLLNILCHRQPAKVLRINGRQSWRSMTALLYDILALIPAIDRSTDKAVKRGRREPALHELQDEAARRLLTSSRVLAIDEGQYLTGATINFLKDVINQGVETGVRFYVVVAGLDTLLKKLESSAGEEVKQLRHNRLFRRFTLTPPTPDDCRDFIERSMSFAGGEELLKKTFADIARSAAGLGHWGFLRDVRDDLKSIRIKGPKVPGHTLPVEVGLLREIAEETKKALSGI